MTERLRLGLILHEMGTDAAAVASTLRATGLRGVRHSSRTLNPVVYYAQSRLWSDAALWWSSVSARDVVLGERLRFDFEDEVVEVDLPGPVRSFLAAFNRGEYPDLEMTTD